MFRRLVLALILLPCLAAAAQAGAWSRGKGKTFIASSGQIEGPDSYGFYRQTFTLYAEHGLSDRLTAGADLGGDGTRMSKIIGFLRWPLRPEARTVKLAFEMGAGQVQAQNVLRPGLSLGRNLSLWDRNGWLALDGRTILFGGANIALESDFTFGLSTTRKTKLILQVQAAHPVVGDAYARFAPSFIYETRPGQHIEFGLRQMVYGGRAQGVKLGLWRSF
ncbi:hypothetical protein [Roseovarius sp.]|uniref:hypothetical protein n=1 Tax=Roseovarius sp. TaxID=1486281 RepID=UPI002619DFC1|nr:hypothetical protein [Roseovarius sp.]